MVGMNPIIRNGNIVNNINDIKQSNKRKSMNNMNNNLSSNNNSSVNNINNPINNSSMNNNNSTINNNSNINNRKSMHINNINSMNNNNNNNNSLNSMHEEIDLPITYQCDNLFDWSHCRPNHRTIMHELNDNKFAIEIENEPVIYYFTRNISNNTSNNPQTNHHHYRKSDVNGLGRSLTSTISSSSNTTADFLNNNRFARYSGGFVYLTEIHYYLQIKTGQVSLTLFVS